MSPVPLAEILSYSFPFLKLFKAFEYTIHFTAASNKSDLFISFCIVASAREAVAVNPSDSDTFFAYGATAFFLFNIVTTLLK